MSDDDLDVLKEYWDFFKKAPKINNSDDKKIWADNKLNIKTAFDNLRKKIIMLDDNTKLLKNMNEIETIYDSLNDQYPGVEKPKEAPEDTQKDDDNIDKLNEKINELYTEIGKLSNENEKEQAKHDLPEKWAPFGKTKQDIEEKVKEALKTKKNIYLNLTIGGKITYKENDNDKKEATLITIKYDNDDSKYIVYKDKNIEEVSVKNVTGAETKHGSELDDIMDKKEIEHIFGILHPEESLLKQEKAQPPAPPEASSEEAPPPPPPAEEAVAPSEEAPAEEPVEEAAAPAEEAAPPASTVGTEEEAAAKLKAEKDAVELRAAAIIAQRDWTNVTKEDKKIKKNKKIL